MKTVLLTGGAGFIGGHLARLLVKEYRVINLDALTYAANPAAISDLAALENYRFVHGDIRDQTLVAKIFQSEEIDAVIHLAAQSHVDRSFADAALFFDVNVLGTGCLLDAARACWSLGGQAGERAYRSGVRFIAVSTDEVYGDIPGEGFFAEDAPLRPNNPYAASKAAADLLVGSYHKTYAFPAIITRGTNTFGPGQHPEKLIPHLICAARAHAPLPIHGDGRQVRDWLYVADHCEAILTVLQQGRVGEVYHIGANEEHSVLDIARRVSTALPEASPAIAHVADRLIQDRRYALALGKIRRELGWSPRHPFKEALAATVNWYLSQGEDARYFDNNYVM